MPRRGFYRRDTTELMQLSLMDRDELHSLTVMNTLIQFPYLSLNKKDGALNHETEQLIELGVALC